MIKQKLTALFAAVVMSSAVLADDLSVQPVSNAFDESKVFELTPNQQRNVVELSETEMKETEGEFVPLAVLAAGLTGGAISAWVRHAKEYLTEGELASVDDVAIATFIGAAYGAAGATVIGASGSSIAAKIVWNGNLIPLNSLTQQIANELKIGATQSVR